jgi:hypothetical protein
MSPVDGTPITNRVEELAAIRHDRDRWRKVAHERNDMAKRSASMLAHISGLEDQLASFDQRYRIVSMDRDVLGYALDRIRDHHHAVNGVCATCTDEFDNPALWPCPTGEVLAEVEDGERQCGVVS